MRFRVRTPDQNFVFESDNETVSVGRSSENDFIVPLNDFSRKHCLITIRGNYVFLMDLGSKNGVMIDGLRITPNKQYPIYKTTSVYLANHFQFLQDAKAEDEVTA